MEDHSGSLFNDNGAEVLFVHNVKISELNIRVLLSKVLRRRSNICGNDIMASELQFTNKFGTNLAQASGHQDLLFFSGRRCIASLDESSREADEASCEHSRTRRKQKKQLPKQRPATPSDAVTETRCKYSTNTLVGHGEGS
jgi:hypothetical protein